MHLQFLAGLNKVRLAHDVVPVKNTSGLVTAKAHRDPFRYSCPHVISYCCAPEIVNYQTVQLRFFAARLPRFSEVAYSSAVSVEDKQAIRQTTLSSALNDLQKLVSKRQEPS